MERRAFLLSSLAATLSAKEPQNTFPTEPRARLAVSSYPFRSTVRSLEEFAGTVPSDFKVNGIEPWSRHFQSLEPTYLHGLRQAFSKAKVRVVNITADLQTHPCSADNRERKDALDQSGRWLDAAVVLQSPSIRIHVPTGANKKADLPCAIQTLTKVAALARDRNVVVHLENDDPRSEDPFLVAKLIDQVKSPFLRALPDFCNSMLISDDPAYNRRGMQALFERAYAISHVKDSEEGDGGRLYRVDVSEMFAIARKANYRGYFSMEMDRPGDPFAGTRSLIEESMQALSAS